MTMLRALARDQRGASMVEFALITPMLLLTLFAMFDFGHTMYAQSLLQGAVENAARDSTIQGTTTLTLDNKVSAIVDDIVPGARPAFSRKYYTNFSDVIEPEEFDDLNGNQTCDGESYEDANGNSTWDTNRARDGRGGARDAVVYKVTVTYPRMFPVARYVGFSNDNSINAIAVMRNQPYSMQNNPTQSRICP